MRRFVQFAGLVSIAAILFFINYLLVSEFDRSRALAAEVERSHALRSQLQSVLSIHQDIETSQRGFALAGDPVFLEPYESGFARIGPALDRLAALSSMDRTLRTGLPQLRALTRDKLQFVSAVVDLTRAGRAEDAAALVATGRGRATMDQIRALVERMDEAERAQLADRSQQADSARRRAQTVAFALQATLFLLLVVALWLAVRAFAAERRATADFRDVSLRQQAIFDAATDGMVIHDRDGRIESHNPSIARQFGYKENALVGKPIDILFENAPDPAELHHFLDRLAANPTGRASQVRELGACRKDGSHFPVDVASSLVEVAGGTRFLAVIRDATQRKQVERMKTEFVSTVSHELRTPLTSIAGSLGLLSGGAAGPLPEKAQRLIKIAHSNSERLVRLINDILDIEKIESGKMVYDLKWVAIQPLVEQCAAAMAGFASEYGVALEVKDGPADPTVVADEDRLTQVLTNLMSNAMKFSPKGEKVEVWLESDAAHYHILVADRGSGISAEFKDRIFGKFAQADSSDSRQKGGTGLGLAICREIVSAFGGEIGFEDRYGGGTVFRVALPSATSPSLEPDGAIASSRESALPWVLHVDDDPDTLRLVASAFEGRAEVHSTPSVREAHAALHRRRFDAAIIDIQLADGSGLDLLPLLRDRGEATPTVIYSVTDANPALAGRVDAVVTKSRSTLDDLVGTVIRLSRKRRREDR